MGAWLSISLLVCVACGPLRGDAPAGDLHTQIVPSMIREISIERRCFGCDKESKITLRRNGTGTRIQFGNARAGTVDRQSAGTVNAKAFDDLAQRVVSEGFFDLKNDYRDPQMMDGAWARTTVVAGTAEKVVLDRDNLAPPGLRRLQARFDEVAAAVAWKDGR